MNISYNGHILTYKYRLKDSEIVMYICSKCGKEIFYKNDKPSKWNYKLTCDELIIKNIIE